MLSSAPTNSSPLALSEESKVKAIMARNCSAVELEANKPSKSSFRAQGASDYLAPLSAASRGILPTLTDFKVSKIEVKMKRQEGNDANQSNKYDLYVPEEISITYTNDIRDISYTPKRDKQSQGKGVRNTRNNHQNKDRVNQPKIQYNDLTKPDYGSLEHLMQMAGYFGTVEHLIIQSRKIGFWQQYQKAEPTLQETSVAKNEARREPGHTMSTLLLAEYECSHPKNFEDSHSPAAIKNGDSPEGLSMGSAFCADTSVKQLSPSSSAAANDGGYYPIENMINLSRYDKIYKNPDKQVEGSPHNNNSSRATDISNKDQLQALTHNQMSNSSHEIRLCDDFHGFPPEKLLTTSFNDSKNVAYGPSPNKGFKNTKYEKGQAAYSPMLKSVVHTKGEYQNSENDGKERIISLPTAKPHAILSSLRSKLSTQNIHRLQHCRIPLPAYGNSITTGSTLSLRENISGMEKEGSSVSTSANKSIFPAKTPGLRSSPIRRTHSYQTIVRQKAVTVGIKTPATCRKSTINRAKREMEWADL